MADRIQRLAEDLLRINRGEIGTSEAKRLLSGIDEVELSLAEQRLLEQGVSPEELQGLCRVHLQVLDRQVQDLKELLEPGHPLHTLISEHELILSSMDAVQKVAKAFSTKTSWSFDDDEDHLLETLVESAFDLVEAEKHHQREEDALFPAVENQGITGPTRIMRLEHGELRPRKKALLDAARNARQMDFAEFNQKLQELSSFIGYTLRDHILKENTILYPAAFAAIKDSSAWEEIKHKCDAIGYCCFTPAV